MSASWDDFEMRSLNDQEFDKYVEAVSDSAVNSLQNVISLGDGLSQVIRMARMTRCQEQLPDDDHLDLAPQTTRPSGDTVLRGRVKWFDSREGMGYIAVARGSEVPVQCQDFEVFSRSPKAGEQVEFVIEHGWACKVRLIEPPADG